MAYMTTQDIIDRVGTKAAYQLTTDTGTTPDQNVLENVRVAAEGEVDRYLSRRIATPVDVSSDSDLASALKALSLDVAEYRLLSRKPLVSDAQTKMYNDAVKWLESFAKGDANLPGAVTPASQTTDLPDVKWNSATPNASRENIV